MIVFILSFKKLNYVPTYIYKNLKSMYNLKASHFLSILVIKGNHTTFLKNVSSSASH